MNYKNINLIHFFRYHSAAAMRSAYNTGGVSSTGGVSDCAGLQSIGAAITSAATGTEKHIRYTRLGTKIKISLRER